MDESTESKPKRKGRGPGKRPRMFCTSIRLPKEVVDYFNKYHPKDKQVQMRSVLIDYVHYELSLKESKNGPQEIVNE